MTDYVMTRCSRRSEHTQPNGKPIDATDKKYAHCSCVADSRCVETSQSCDESSNSLVQCSKQAKISERGVKQLEQVSFSVESLENVRTKHSADLNR